MTLSDELQKLEALLHTGTLTPEEFQLAKQRVLTESPVADVRDDVEEMKAQLALIQLDREWELERQKYIVYTRDGIGRAPTWYVLIAPALVLPCPLLLVVYVELFTPYPIESNPDPSIKYFVSAYVILLVVFVWSAIGHMIMIKQYQKAHSHYMRRRSELLALNKPIQFESPSN